MLASFFHDLTLIDYAGGKITPCQDLKGLVVLAVCYCSGLASNISHAQPQLKLVNKFGNLNSIKLKKYNFMFFQNFFQNFFFQKIITFFW